MQHYYTEGAGAPNRAARPKRPGGRMEQGVDRRIVARWQDWSGNDLQHLVLKIGSDAILAEAVVLFTDEARLLAARLRIECDGGWRVRSVEAGLIGDDRRMVLEADGAGRWRDEEGRPLPALAGAIDVDLPLTPFTNTLPIRRLDLAAGQSADITVAYLLLPEYRITTDPQRYTCLEPRRRYRYESLDSDFVRDIAVDADGLVMTYPGLFRRLP
jgi:hypothetical protein